MQNESQCSACPVQPLSEQCSSPSRRATCTRAPGKAFKHPLAPTIIPLAQAKHRHGSSLPPPTVFPCESTCPAAQLNACLLAPLPAQGCSPPPSSCVLLLTDPTSHVTLQPCWHLRGQGSREYRRRERLCQYFQRWIRLWDVLEHSRGKKLLWCAVPKHR